MKKLTPYHGNDLCTMRTESGVTFIGIIYFPVPFRLRPHIPLDLHAILEMSDENNARISQSLILSFCIGGKNPGGWVYIGGDII
jgi:hypothetical protein